MALNTVKHCTRLWNKIWLVYNIIIWTITSGAVLLDARHRCTQRKMEMDRSSLCGFAWSRTLWILGGSCCLVPSMPTLHAWVGPLALCCTPALTQKPIICGIVARSMPAQEKPNELLQVAEEQLLSLEKQMMFGQSCVWNQWRSMCIWSLEAQAHEDPWWEARRDRERKAEESEWYHVIYYLPMCHFTVSLQNTPRFA